MRPFQPGIAAKLNKPVRLLIGALTLWPIVYIVVVMFVFVIGFFISSAAFTSSSRLPQTSPPQIFPFPLFGVFFALQFFTIFLVYGLMALYIVDVFRNDYITSDRKALWAAVLFLGSFIAMPIYWYLYFWRDKSKDSPPFSAPYGQHPPYPPYTQYPPGTPPPPYYPPYPPYPQYPAPQIPPVPPPQPPAPPVQ